MRLSFILARVAARSGVALWRHRIALLLAGLIAVAVGLYEMSYAGPTSPSVDCADTTMAAVTRIDDDMARAAYDCLDVSMRNSTEDAFVAGMRERDMPPGQVNRVGDSRTKDGGRIVFFTVEQQGGAVGYIVYLDPAGKVKKVE